MLTAGNLRISVAFSLSICAHIAFMGLDFNWISNSVPTVVDRDRRVTITFAPRRIEAVSAPTVVKQKTASPPVVKESIVPEILPIAEETIDVLVREIPSPVARVKTEISPPIAESYVSEIKPEALADKSKAAAGNMEAVVIKEARPLYRENPPPAYPSVARRRGYQGTVLLEVLVDQQGRAADLRIFKSSGYDVLDQAAEKAVRGWRFEPGINGDKRVEMWVRVPIRFKLR